MVDMEYCHTQKAPLHWLGHGLAIVLLVSAWLSRATPAIEIILAVTACVTVVFAFSFRYLTVTGQGEWLSVRFGPLPIFGKRIPYSDITAVKAGCSWASLGSWAIDPSGNPTNYETLRPHSMNNSMQRSPSLVIVAGVYLGTCFVTAEVLYGLSVLLVPPAFSLAAKTWMASFFFVGTVTAVCCGGGFLGIWFIMASIDRPIRDDWVSR